MIEAREISMMLAERIEDLVVACLPNGVRDGHEWRVGSINGEPGRSLGVHLSGNRRGWWVDFSAPDDKGDALELVTQTLCNGDRKAAYKWSLGYLGLTNADPKAVENARRKAAQTRKQSEARQAEDAAKSARRAKGLWLSGQNISGTPAEDYLLNRAIDIRKLSRPPSALRFQKETWCSERQGKHPAILACATDDGGTLVCCHRTYLGLQSGEWTKARMREPKKAYGLFGGAAIRLQRGEAGTPWNKMPEGDTVAIAEGVEDALTIATLYPSWRVISALSVGNMGNIKLPVWAHVMLIADNDDGKKARAALQKAATTHTEAGHLVRILRAPSPHHDFNDYLMAEARSHV